MYGSAPAPAEGPLQAAPSARGRRDRDAQTLEFSDDTSVAPVRVLVAEPQDQRAQRRLERRPSRSPVRIRPAAGEELTVPAHQRLGLDREARPGDPRQRAAQRRQQRPISPRQLRLSSLPTEHRKFMAQHQDLELLRATRPRQQPDEREQVPHRRDMRTTTASEPSLPTTARALNLARWRWFGEPGRVCEPYGVSRCRPSGKRGSSSSVRSKFFFGWSARAARHSSSRRGP